MFKIRLVALKDVIKTCTRAEVKKIRRCKSQSNLVKVRKDHLYPLTCCSQGGSGPIYILVFERIRVFLACVLPIVVCISELIISIEGNLFQWHPFASCEIKSCKIYQGGPLFCVILKVLLKMWFLLELLGWKARYGEIQQEKRLHLLMVFVGLENYEPFY